MWTFPRDDQYGSGVNPDGAVIVLGHCENEDDVHRYDSMEINLYTPDELTTYTQWIYEYIGFQRTRTSDPNLPAIIRAAGMPGGIGHTWVKNRFVTPYPKGGKLLYGRGGIKRIYIHSTLADNPNIDPNYAQNLEAIQSKAERDAKKYGSWDAYLGQVFDEFRDHKYSDEPENALHVVDAFDKTDSISYGIPEWWPKIIAMDWGYAPPAATSILYGAISPERRLVIFHEDWFQKTLIEDWASKIKHRIEILDPKVIKLCQSAGQQRGQEHTIHQQISTALNRPIELTSNSAGTRVAGKTLIHEYLRWKPKYTHKPEQNPFNQDFADWLQRNKSESDYRAYIDLFKAPPVENNLPKLIIFNHCTNVINSIKACVYAKNNPQDVEEFPGDDPYDALRYIVDAADRYFDDAVDEMKKLEKRQALSLITDMTAYYRNARKLDEESRGPMGVVKSSIRGYYRR
jgi:hypothetical protein